jgi:autotransporter-associated beta strand protein
MRGSRRAGRFILCTAATLAAAQARVAAQVTNWTGNGNTGLWDDAANWSAGVPTATSAAWVGLPSQQSTIDLGGVTRPAASISAGAGIGSVATLSNGVLNTTDVNANSPLVLSVGLTNTLSNRLSIGGDLDVMNPIIGSGFTLVAEPRGGIVSLWGVNTYTGNTLVRGPLQLLGRFANSPLVHVQDGFIDVDTTTGFGGAAQTLRTTRGRIEIGNVGAVTLAKMHAGVGRSVFEITNATATAPSITRDVGGILEMNPLGTSPDNRLRFTATPTLFGDNASATRRPIVPWVVTDTGERVFMTYAAGSGFRALAQGSGEFASTPTAGANVRLENQNTQPVDISVNSLSLFGGTLTLANGATMTVASGGVLLNSDLNHVGATITGPGRLTLPAEGIIHAVNYPIVGSPPITHTINAMISGGTLVKSGAGTLALGSFNSYTGGTVLTGGTLLVQHVAALTNGPITFSCGSSDLTRLTFSVPLATLANNLVLSTGTDTAAELNMPVGTSVNLTGALSGDGTLRVSNNAAYRYSGTGAATGAYRLELHNGTLLVDGVLPSIDGRVGNTGTGVATIGGSGVVGGELRPVGTTFSPGEATLGDAARLTAGVGNFFGNTMRFDLNGLVAGDDFDQLAVTSSLLLSDNPVNDNDLDVRFGFSPVFGQQFRIIDDQFAGAVNGSFAGLPEGSFFSRGGQFLYITYSGGDGNDVVLTVVPEPGGAMALAAAGLAALTRLRRPRVSRR